MPNSLHALGILVLTVAWVLLPGYGRASGVEIEFLTEELPWAVMDRVYAPPPLEVGVSGSCPAGGVGYTVVAGHLPPGIKLSRLGYFSGTPSRGGSFELTIRAATGCSAIKKPFTMIVTGAPVVSANPSKLNFEWRPGVVSPEQIVHISATWPKLPYEIAVKDGDWLTASPDHGFTPREGSAMGDDPVRVRVDGSRMKPGTYSAIVTISASQAVPAPPVTIQLVVTGN